jgi:hypothetical protein
MTAESPAEAREMTRASATALAGGASPDGSALGRPVSQVAIVVPDLDRAMSTWWEGLAIGPWHVYTLGSPPLSGATYRGRSAPFRIRIALAFSGGVMFELIEPLEGESIWHESLLRSGSACFQHVAIYVEDYEAAIGEMIRRGWRAVQTGEGFGRSADGALTYFEHDLGAGVLVEVVRGPRERYAPERIYPLSEGKSAFGP